MKADFLIIHKSPTHVLGHLFCNYCTFFHAFYCNQYCVKTHQNVSCKGSSHSGRHRSHFHSQVASIRAAATLYDVPRTTLSDRINGKLTHTESRQSQLLLSLEKELVALPIVVNIGYNALYNAILVSM
jgi:helix-turn-helix, Psq domain